MIILTLFNFRKMKTSQGFKYSIKNDILTLEIPKTMGKFNTKVQEAKRELCLDHSLYFTEIRTIKI